MRRAPEPTDVYWDNLQYTYFDRVKKMFLTYLATLVLIGACFGVIYAINVGKSKLVENTDPSSANYSTVKGLTILCSFIIVIINNLLIFVILSFSRSEKQLTYSDFSISVAYKLTFARFVNTSLIPVVVNIAIEYWFSDGGMVSDFFYIILSASFLTPMLYYFDMFYTIKRIRRCIEKSRGSSSTMT